MGVLLVGVADVSFTFLQLTSGIILLNIATVGGPIIWLLATLITPFGMTPLSKSFTRRAL